MSLHPDIAAWFAARHGAPTAVQQAAWPAIARGEHVLATAPTGSGKTLAAALMALQSLLLGKWPAGQTSVLYVSPLKALSADVQRNLLAPLQELSAHLRALGWQLPALTVALRTGDTAQRDRQAMLRRPPEILVTTPESLHLLLVAAGGRRMLQSVRLAILDEIHAVAPNKRGVLLMAGMEELARLAGPVQRVALSATVRPLDAVARLVGGCEWQGGQAYDRPVTVLAPPHAKRFDMQIIDAELDATDPNAPKANGDDGGFWPAAAKVLRQRVVANQSTLLFVNSRRTAERLARELNDGQAMPLAWAHHGSLAQDLRRTVEARLKDGQLKAVCATSSLELGIDVGAVDEVVLLGAPRTVAAALQRVGRAGHQVGAVSRGRLLPMFGRDILRSAVLCQLMQAGIIEPLLLPKRPADVLAQLILARLAAQAWQADELFDHLRGCDAFRDLPRADFDAVVEMLAGRWSGLRLRELQPRIDVGKNGKLTARKGTATLVARSGGVIADRGYFKLVVHGSGTPIGELDEEFVWERRTGDVFAIGAQSWQVVQKTHDTVEVAPGRRGIAMAPFWRADPDDRDPLVSEATADFLAAVEPHLDDADFAAQLAAKLPCNEPALATVVQMLRQAKRHLGQLPARDRIVLELARGADDSATQAILHAGWGGVVLRPLGIALHAYLEAHTGLQWQVQSSDDCVLVRVPDGVDLLPLLDQFIAEPVEPWLRRGLPMSATFGLHFREAAGTALLIPRSPAGKRVPLFQTRERSKQLLAALAHDPAFPLLADAARACIEERFDLPRLQAWLGNWRDGSVQLHVAHTTSPSALADWVVFLSQGALIYEDDKPAPPEPLHAVAADPALRPELPAELVEKLRRRRMRCDDDWRPRDLAELADAVAELGPLSDSEIAEMAGVLAADVPEIAVATAAGRWVCPAEADLFSQLPSLPASDPRWPMAALRFVRTRGPFAQADFAAAFGIAAALAGHLLAPLLASGQVVAGVRVSGCADPLLCDAEFVQLALRVLRSARKPAGKPKPRGELLLLRAHLHGLLQPKAGPVAVAEVLTALRGLPLPLALLESDILPARVANYRPSDLDTALSEFGLAWRGCGTLANPCVQFFAAGQQAVWAQAAKDNQDLAALLPDADAAYPTDVLLRKLNYDRERLSQLLFGAVFAGQLHCDGFASVRKGLQHGFAAPPLPARPPKFGRGLPVQPLLPWPGPWRRVDRADPQDAVDYAEMAAERAHAAAGRWGLLHRNAVPAEDAGGWRQLLPALRRLDWSGELLAGAWFEQLPGLQLLAPACQPAWAELGAHRERIWWLHSLDPCSPCGAGIDFGLGEPLPVRADGTWMVFCGAALAAVARGGGRQVAMLVAEDSPQAAQVAAALVARFAGAAGGKCVIDAIDGQDAVRSPWRRHFAALGLQADFKSLTT